ncbi:MAG: eCIS core domain-containing protein [Longimicrobiales bacterium]
MMGRLLRLATTPEGRWSGPLPRGVRMRRSRWIPALAGRLSGMPGPASAVTLGDTIVVHPAVPLEPRLLRHELAHVRQWRERPLLFPLRYAWLHLRHGYDRNPYEVEARAAETAARDADPPTERPR